MVLLLVPMLLLVLSTQHFFDRQIQENERNYLQVAMKTVRNDMENRMDEMRKAGLLFAGDSDINKAMYDDRNRLAMALNNLKRNFNYLDYVVIVDRENRILASSSPYLLYPDGSAVKILAASSMLFGKTHVSEEVVGLEELFTKDSFEYDNFSIKILNQFPGAQEYLHKALMGIVVVPIRDKSADNNVIGAIAEQDQKKVFVEFEQVDSSYTREYEGTGLGLPLVKKMVEMHGGYVYLKSALGEGTEVIFLIPLQQGMKKQ